MKCLADDELELLVRGHARWWRRFFWHAHLRRCGSCQSRWHAAQEDEDLLVELRQAISAPVRPSPLSTARSGLSRPPGHMDHLDPADSNGREPRDEP